MSSRKQAALGLPVVTDGELRRRNFQESFGSSVSGFEVAAEDRAMEGVNTAPLARAEQNFSAPGPAIVTRRKAVERLAPRAQRAARRNTSSPARSPTGRSR